MLEKFDCLYPGTTLPAILQHRYGGLAGHVLIDVMSKGYEEIRYPTAVSSALGFPIEHSEVYNDPLRSSGISNLVAEIVRIVARELSASGVASGAWNRLCSMPNADPDVLERFTNILFRGRPGEFFEMKQEGDDAA